MWRSFTFDIICHLALGKINIILDHIGGGEESDKESIFHKVLFPQKTLSNLI